MRRRPRKCTPRCSLDVPRARARCPLGVPQARCWFLCIANNQAAIMLMFYLALVLPCSTVKNPLLCAGQGRAGQGRAGQAGSILEFVETGLH